MADARKGNAPVQFTPMPEKLRQLAARVQAPEAPSSALLSAPPPVPTTELLEGIDHLYRVYLQLIELSAKSYDLCRADRCSERSEAEAASRQIQQVLEELERTVGQLQYGIRTKVSQTGRMAMIEYLRGEVEERRAAVHKMENVLEEAQRTQRS